MSPEQARGQAGRQAERHLGVRGVLYEMLTGGRLTRAGTETGEDVTGRTLPRDTPDALQRLVARCLDPNPRQRLRDIGEARIVLEGGDLEPSAGFVVPLKKRPFWWRAIW